MSDAPKTIFYQEGFVETFVAEIPSERANIPYVEYTRTDSIPSPDALIRAALEAMVVAVSKIPTRTESLGGQSFKYVKISEVDQTILALADDPEALAAIRKAAEGRG